MVQVLEVEEYHRSVSTTGSVSAYGQKKEPYVIVQEEDGDSEVITPREPLDKRLLSRALSGISTVEIKTPDPPAKHRRLNYSASDSKLLLNRTPHRSKQRNPKRLTLITQVQGNLIENGYTSNNYNNNTNLNYDSDENVYKQVDDTVITTIPPSPVPVYSYATIIESPPVSPSSKVTSYRQRNTRSTSSYANEPVTPTKYTYEHTSFDSGIADYSPQLSPGAGAGGGVHDTSSSSLREVRTKYRGDKKKMSDSGRPGERRFLKKVQRELEDQKSKWETEVEHLSDSFSQTSIPESGKATQQGENSYVDTSSGKPIFKAFVDVSSYAKSSLSVNVDTLTNKVIVTAMKAGGGIGHVTNTFTQKISLPRFADEQNLRSHVSKKGILKIEVPLIYYFQRPDDAKQRDRKAKSFVYQVEDKNGQRVLEILVNTGSEYRAKELKVLVQDDRKLVIIGEKATAGSADVSGSRHPEQKLIKQYSLPDYADVDHITSKMGKDGRLQINVPIPNNHH